MKRTEAAQRAERLTLAVIRGEVSINDVREELHLAARERDTADSASALRKYRNGEPVWAWPSVAPWAGF